MFKFEVILNDTLSNARLGIIKTPHGIIETPAFIFCATKADIKSVTIDHVKNANSQMILSNTYHLMLQPGGDVIKKAGGLHKFIGWQGPMLTDSGGFQIFSLGYGSVASEIKGSKLLKTKKTVLKITDDGCHFRSYIDGQRIFLTPELSARIQNDLGADLIVSFDECTPYHVNKLYTATSMEKSKKWSLRSLKELQTIDEEKKQRMLAVIQGGVYEDLRRESANFANENDFFGFAIGGSLGKTVQQMYDIVEMTASMLDKKRNVHLLGIGGIKDIFHGVKCGIDTFDCVAPTRIARHGAAIVKQKELPEYGTSGKYINLTSSHFKYDYSQISSQCDCYTCQNFSRSYIHHLIKAKETVAGTLVSIHNIYTMNRLLSDIRKAISEKTLDQTYKDWCE